MNKVTTSVPVTSVVSPVATPVASVSVSAPVTENGSVGLPPATSPPASALISITAESLNAEIISLQREIEIAEQRKIELEREIQAALREKINEVPAFLGLGNLREVLDLLKSQMNGAIKISHLPYGRGKGHHLPEDIIGQMKEMLKARETAAYISDKLRVGLSTVEAYKARWGLTKRHRNNQGIPSLKRSSSNRISPAKRNEIVAALIAGRATVTRLAERFGVSRQSLYHIRRGVRKAHVIAA